MMEIRGFKGFKDDFRNKYGKPFETGVVYSRESTVLKFGENGKGYHFAVSLADTFRFFNPCLDNMYCEVLGTGNFLRQDPYLYNSDVMYVVEKLEIIRVLSREDILQYVCQADMDELRRFFALFPFTKAELEALRKYFIEKGYEYEQFISRAMEYQTGDRETFKRNPKYLRRGMKWG